MKAKISVACAVILFSFSPLPSLLKLNHTLTATPAYAAGAKAGAKSLFEQANQKYISRQYLQAYTLYSQSITKENAGPTAWLYMGHCALALQHQGEAAKIYQTIVNRYPTAPEARTAAAYYNKCNGGASGAAPGGQPAASAKAVAAQDDAAGDSPLAKVPAATNAANVATLIGRIKMIKPSFGHPELDKLTIGAINYDIENLPPSVVRLLVKGNIKFCLTPSLIDRNPELGYQEGRGYDGATYKACPGMFSDSTVVICEHTVNEQSNEFEPTISTGQISQTFFHEIGHALDQCLGEYSHSPEYRHNYYLDIARIPSDAAGRLAYYMQKSDAGQEESCGEISAVALGGASRNAEDIKTCFPLTLAYVKQKLGIK